jgi:hypothetical protein
MRWSNPATRPDLMDLWQLLMAAGRWAITALAVSQGAPFWFDLLNRLVNLRATGEQPTTPEPVERRESQLVIQAQPAQVDAQIGVGAPALPTTGAPGD